jgi:hypothetical protein
LQGIAESGTLFSMRWRLVLLVILWVAPAAGQSPDVGTGNGFYALCADAKLDSQVRSACWGYFRGAYDMLVFQPGTDKAICLPSGVTYQQMYDMLLRELADKPQDRHYRTAGILSGLLWEKFSCSGPVR